MCCIDEIVDLCHEALTDDNNLPQDAPLTLLAMSPDGI